MLILQSVFRFALRCYDYFLSPDVMQFSRVTMIFNCFSILTNMSLVLLVFMGLGHERVAITERPIVYL